MGVRLLKASVIGLALLLGGVLLLAPVQAQTPPPFTAYGTGLTHGDVVTVFVDGAQCGEDLADTAGNWGPIQVRAEAPCLAEDGDTISFLLNGLPTNESETWSSGGAPSNVATGTVLTLVPPTFQGGFIENGVNIGVWGGGSFGQLVQLAESEGCDVYSFWVSVAQQLVGYFDGAPAFANAGMLAVYPDELIPPGTVMLVVCGDARSVAPAPFTAYGTGIGAGDRVEAFVGGTSCGSATADGAGQWGPLLISEDAPCAPEPGGTISFQLNGLPTNETETWQEGTAPADVARGTQLTLTVIHGVIDFEGDHPQLTPGSTVDVVGYPKPGGITYVPGPIGSEISISGLNPFYPGQNAAMLFDSTCAEGCTGADADLQVSGFGNVLVVSDNVDGANPGDLAGSHGQALSFDFSSVGEGTVYIESFDVVDIEADEVGQVDLFGVTGEPIGSVPIVPTGGDNTHGVLAVGLGGVSRMVVVLGGSGAIDNIRFTLEHDAPPPPPPPPPPSATIEVSAFHRVVRAAEFLPNANLDIWVTRGDDTLAATTVTTDSSGGARWDSVPSLASGRTVHASDGTTTKQLRVSTGPDLGFWDGGTTEEYVSAANDAGASVLRANIGSEELLYILGAPDFVNQMFVDAFAGFISAGAEVEMGFPDLDRDVLLVIPFKTDATALVQASVQQDFVCAADFFVGQDVSLRILDAPGGTELATVTSPRSLDTICWEIEDTDVDLDPGMLVEVSNGFTTQGVELFRVSLGSWTGGTLENYLNAVTGIEALTMVGGSLEDGLVVYVIGAPTFVNQAFIDAYPGGFDPSVVEVSVRSDVRVLFPPYDDALSLVLLSDEPPPSPSAQIQAFVGADAVCASNYQPGFDLTLIVRATPGGVELGRFTQTATNRTCWTESETGIDLTSGMEVVVTDSVTVRAAALFQTSLGTWTGGTFPDYRAAVSGIGGVVFYGGTPESPIAYIIGAPMFVNQAFIDAHPGGFDPSVIEVAIRDDDGDDILFPLYDAATALVPVVEPAAATASSPPTAGPPPAASVTAVPEPQPLGSSFSVAPSALGFALTSFSGGPVADLELAAWSAGAISLVATSEGRFVVLIVGAPTWVNGEFVALFEGGVPAGQALMLIIR